MNDGVNADWKEQLNRWWEGVEDARYVEDVIGPKPADDEALGVVCRRFIEWIEATFGEKMRVSLLAKYHRASEVMVEEAWNTLLISWWNKRVDPRRFVNRYHVHKHLWEKACYTITICMRSERRRYGHYTQARKIGEVTFTDQFRYFDDDSDPVSLLVAKHVEDSGDRGELVELALSMLTPVQAHAVETLVFGGIGGKVSAELWAMATGERLTSDEMYDRNKSAIRKLRRRAKAGMLDVAVA